MRDVRLSGGVSDCRRILCNLWDRTEYGNRAARQWQAWFQPLKICKIRFVMSCTARPSEYVSPGSNVHRSGRCSTSYPLGLTIIEVPLTGMPEKTGAQVPASSKTMAIISRCRFSTSSTLGSACDSRCCRASVRLTSFVSHAVFLCTFNLLATIFELPNFTIGIPDRAATKPVF